MRPCIAALLVAGCYDPDLSKSSFRCEAECPSGFECVEGECVDYPVILITDPVNDDVFSADERFNLVVEVYNFTLSRDFDSPPVEGEGHWHWSLDDVYQAAVGEPSVAVGPLDVGCRVLKAELVENDHTPLDVFDEVTVTVDDGGPRICIVSPPRGEALDPGPVTVTVEVAAFDLDDLVLTGHGHWHAAVDREDTGNHFRARSGTVPLAGVGDRTVEREIAVQLVTNDEAPLDPPRMASVRVEVRPAE